MTDTKNINNTNAVTISDDDFTRAELAEIYCLESYQHISCEEDVIEHNLETMGIWK